MKTILLLCVLSILFYSCSKKESPSPSITGKWYLVSDSSSTYENGALSDTYYHAENHQDYTQFNTDGTGASVIVQDINSGQSTLKFTYKSSGSSITTIFPSQTSDGIEYTGITEAGTIESLTDNRLTIKFDDTAINGGNSIRVVETEQFIK